MLISDRDKELLGIAADPTLETLAELRTRTTWSVGALIEIISRHFCNADVQVYSIRREVDATDWHVKLFGRELGLTPQDLICECRLETASRLLRDTTLGIPVIAALVGYKTARSLGYLFDRLYGRPPSKLRNDLRRIKGEDRDRVEKLFSWHFRVRYHRGEVENDELRQALAYFEGRLGLS